MLTLQANSKTMRKLFTLLFAVVLVSSCDINTDPVELTVNSSFTEPITVNIPQTSGTSVNYNETVTQDLNDIIANFNAITGININSLSYKYKNVTGNTDAEIQSGSISINGTTIASISNVNMAQEAAAGTVFQISDQTILNQLEVEFLNNSSATIQFSGTAISESGPVDFEIEVSIDLTVSL